MILNTSTAPSLADMFLKKKKDLVEKYENQKDYSRHEEKELKPIRTKEEILKQRKAMMEYRRPAVQRAKSEIDFCEIRSNKKSPSPLGRNFGMIQNPYQDNNNLKASKEPNQDLLNRLAFGERAKVALKKNNN